MDQQENKLILIEGVQGAGKSFLIHDCLKKHPAIKHYTFEFSKWVNELDKHSDIHFKNGISIGKDISLMKCIQLMDNFPNTIIERGFLSHAVWSNLEDRDSIDNINIYIKVINNFIKCLNTTLVLVEGRGEDYVRNRKDGYDSKASYEEQVFQYRSYANKFSFSRTILFKNTFDDESINMFNHHIEGVFGI